MNDSRAMDDNLNIENYKRQLETINSLLQNCEESQRDELLSLKKSIEEYLSLTGSNEMDEEYATFMDEINGVSKGDERIEIVELEGKKCRAPYASTYGADYHNAMICSVIAHNDRDKIQVKVLFMNPMQKQMLPCPYFFDKECKFTEERCKFSHGNTVLLKDIKEYKEPDYSSIRIGHTVLAKQPNNLWSRAKIRAIADDKCSIKYENQNKQAELPFDHLLPLHDQNEEPETNDNSSGDERDYQDVINMSLMTPCTGKLGGWEQFTTGIGSKLMHRMGYIVGTGLGKRSDGRIEPVTATIFPQGKSLDHCMNLKEKYGQNLFDADKRVNKIKSKKKQKKIYPVVKPELSEQERRNKMKAKTTRGLNISGLKTEQYIKSVEADLKRLEGSMSRNPSHGLQYQFKRKTRELRKLQERSRNIENEKAVRDAEKKLTKF